ncbi:NAD(P)/FAD-dependent oxidoreductase [Kitasatospora sp. NPDC101801]|uniref:NAD(P)/FAD-dependent oxidoreductase n=1 Tax=Kitasatospora sp. NPDC101801 TaxID=3364103 RepID=UPI0038014CA1
MSARARALVVGAGYAGLLAAHVLATRFREVVLLDRDEITDSDQPRKGVPQGHHPHYLLERGARTLESLLPGLQRNVTADGVVLRDFGTGTRFRLPSGWTPQVRTGIQVQSMTRPYLEQQIRRRVLAHPNVILRSGVPVDGLLTVGGGRRVTGVSAGAEIITADLVVAATGRSNALTAWLAQAGCEPVPERIVPAEVTYTTRTYPTAAPGLNACHAVLLYAPGQPRGGGVMAVEKGRSTLALFGYGANRPPLDDQGFRAFAESLPEPFLAAFLATAPQHTHEHRFIDRGNHWRQLHRARAWPEQLAVVGDAQCRFNPIYAQGLTVATLQAQALGRSLDQGEDVRAFHRRCARIIRVPWLMSSSSDLAWTPRQAPWAARAAHWYSGRLVDRVPTDPSLYQVFAGVQHMRRSPAALASPAVVLKALRRPKEDQT